MPRASTTRRSPRDARRRVRGGRMRARIACLPARTPDASPLTPFRISWRAERRHSSAITCVTVAKAAGNSHTGAGDFPEADAMPASRSVVLRISGSVEPDRAAASFQASSRCCRQGNRSNGSASAASTPLVYETLRTTSPSGRVSARRRTRGTLPMVGCSGSRSRIVSPS